jgi:hypothetical protein
MPPHESVNSFTSRTKAVQMTVFFVGLRLTALCTRPAASSSYPVVCHRPRNPARRTRQTVVANPPDPGKEAPVPHGAAIAWPAAEARLCAHGVAATTSSRAPRASARLASKRLLVPTPTA